jgi:hypothetical protein
MKTTTAATTDHLLLSESIQGVRLEYFGGSISTDVFRLFFHDIEVGQVRFYSSRKTILIRFDLPEDFTDCPDFFRGEDEDTGQPFQCPAWNTWGEFSKALIACPLIR